MRRALIPLACLPRPLSRARAGQGNPLHAQRQHVRGGTLHQRSSGDGVIRCDNGKAMKLTIESVQSKHSGLTCGSCRIIDGIGMYSPVIDIFDLIGGSATAEAMPAAKRPGRTWRPKDSLWQALGGRGRTLACRSAA